MTILPFRPYLRSAPLFAVVFLLLFHGAAFGQSGSPLPLSGRPPGNGSVSSTQTAIPGTTTSVNTLNPAIQVQGPYAGSANGADKAPFSGKLSLREAIQRGIAYNLGAIGLSQAVREAHGQSRVARSALLPNLNGNLSEVVEQVNIRALGIRLASPAPGVSIPSVVGPFNYFDLRATLSQTVADLTAWNNYRASLETVHANEFFSKDAHDLVVLAVGGAYVQVIAAQARVTSARAQLDTANALFQQASERRAVGVLAQIDVNRSQVQVLTQRQRLVSLQNDLAKQKINLARLTGLPPSDGFELTDNIPFTPAPAITLEDALKEALDQRPDLKGAQAQVRASERAFAAARAERLPSLTFSANYGAIGTNPAQSHGTFSVVGSLNIPIWQGGRTEGDIERADAVLVQRKAEASDTVDVTQAFLPLLIRSRGAVVNNLSMNALAPMPLVPGYSAAKAAAFSLTQSSRTLFARQGVSVHAVLTGPVDTDAARGFDIPKATPESVARAILDGVENEEEDIFPDPMSQSLAESWRNGSAKGLERMLAAYVGAQPVKP
jgi:outer membrane protein TolC